MALPRRRSLPALAIAAAVGLTGPGSYSLDALLRIALPTPLSFAIGVVLVLIGTAVRLLTRDPAASPAATPGGAPSATHAR
jgi:hypothetical protein